MDDVIAWLIKNPNQTNALAAVSSAVLAFVAVLIASLSIYFTARGLRLQRNHNRLSVIPVPFIVLSDYEDLLRVRLRNDGIGPLILKTVLYRRGDIVNEQEDLVSYLPALPEGFYWSNFFNGYVRSIRPGDELIFMEIYEKESDLGFSKFREECRRRLATLEIAIDYTDVYGNKFPEFSRKLDWFGRPQASMRTYLGKK